MECGANKPPRNGMCWCLPHSWCFKCYPAFETIHCPIWLRVGLEKFYWSLDSWKSWLVGIRKKESCLDFWVILQKTLIWSLVRNSDTIISYWFLIRHLSNQSRRKTIMMSSKVRPRVCDEVWKVKANRIIWQSKFSPLRVTDVLERYCDYSVLL